MHFAVTAMTVFDSCAWVVASMQNANRIKRECSARRFRRRPMARHQTLQNSAVKRGALPKQAACLEKS
jgi:hypothetical protein